jgi:hypothetical protein
MSYKEVIKREGPYDGQLREYVFGRHSGYTKTFRVKATSLDKAIRAFRVGAMYPHQYSTSPIPTSYGDSYDDKVYMTSAPGAVVPVHVVAKPQWEHVADIEPDAPEDVFGPALLEAQKVLQIASAASGLEESDKSTALAIAGQQAGMSNAPRRKLEEQALSLQRKMAELEAQKRELANQVAEMRSELQRRMEQIWMIELFVGSQEEVKCLREGQPAPAGAKISIRQQVLCMDEEIAVYDWLHNPDRIGQFDHNNLDDFDAWLLDDPAHLHTIFPHEKGIVGLRVRRHKKERGEDQGYQGIAGLFRAVEEQQWDEMTYLLVRNGDNLYRLWVDVNMWPRLFASDEDFKEKVYDHVARDHIRKRIEGRKLFAGTLVVQGLLDRSDLFHPLPVPGLSIVDPNHTEHFEFVRDGENHRMLADPDNPFGHITWPKYYKWLKSQLCPGVRVMYTGPRHFGDKHYDSMESRTGRKSVWAAPVHTEIYTLVEGDPNNERGPWRGDHEFFYFPTDRYKNRVRWGAFSNELIPVDMISWRILEYMIHDRNHRHLYGAFFLKAFHWWKQFKAQTELERPFVDLVLAQTGKTPTEANRAHVERLVRWWKMKTKTHRTLGEDEAKALRMIRRAFERGDDHDNDPEKLLFR